ncbi:hypothetical protein [Polynucleobacter sp. MWH-Jannik1A5]|uniref:hypothetical protein n=1 Tax=Polynucleobacter sp. MWH-Jannik1A5 TaxID=1855890 RepID=UPI001C0E646A|nr:hypothetical protein [Polynucleobacter sp. MWH-Jannik1A5]MBU3546712.1 hypothetical protein [Polynucleobacter sp. MWH-Jannik1A5]
MNKYLFYRITSKSNDKPRLDGFSKMDCLDNLLSYFPDYRMVCIADNCDDLIYEILEKKNFYKLVRTSLGNCGSFKYLLNNELPSLADDDLIYFVEDDYLHRAGSAQALEEGLKYFNYVTLYDHPDKYGINSPNTNPLVPKGPLSEVTQIFRGVSAIWRTTNSTTMTFGVHAKTMRMDSWIWNLVNTGFNTPRDFHAWIYLTGPKEFSLRTAKTIFAAQLLSRMHALLSPRRTLGVPLNSFSAHLQKDTLPENFYSDFMR